MCIGWVIVVHVDVQLHFDKVLFCLLCLECLLLWWQTRFLLGLLSKEPAWFVWGSLHLLWSFERCEEGRCEGACIWWRTLKGPKIVCVHFLDGWRTAAVAGSRICYNAAFAERFISLFFCPRVYKNLIKVADISFLTGSDRIRHWIKW